VNDKRKIEAFSGTHDYDPAHVVASIELDWFDQGDFSPEELARLGHHWADRVTADLTEGRCPRCHDALNKDIVAGSRVTTCRCIPVCPACGSDEGNQMLLGRPSSRVWEWPIGKGHRTRRANKVAANSQVALLSGDRIITSDGSHPLEPRPHPGGWAEYGRDDEN